MHLRAGGATASTEEPGFEAKSDRQFREKEAIALAARALVEPGRVIIAPARRRPRPAVTIDGAAAAR